MIGFALSALVFLTFVLLILTVTSLVMTSSLGRRLDAMGSRLDELAKPEGKSSSVSESPMARRTEEARRRMAEEAVVEPEEESPVVETDLSGELEEAPSGPPPLPAREAAAAVRATPEVASSPVASKETVPESEPGRFESAAREILGKIWSWIIVGEEHRPEGVTMEYAVATNWLLRIGVLVLLFGIGFFLKYSLGAGRIAVSFLIGAALLGIGLRLFRGRFSLLGQGLAGAGLATFYLSFFTAHDYEHLAALPAFGGMILVTVAAGFLAVRFDSLLVAILGLIGGYGTPLMITSDSPNVVVLFSYLLMLGAGVLFIAWKREWRLLHYLGFFATYLLVLLATDQHFEAERFWHFMPFLVAYFVLFSTITFIYHIVNRKHSTILELLFLFLNATAFFAFAVSWMSGVFRREAFAIVTLGLAVFYIGHIYFFLLRHIRDRGLLLSFIGLASFFVVITIPLVIARDWINASWAVQAFVMLWIASRMKSEFLRILALILYCIVFFRFLVTDLGQQFDSAIEPGVAYLRMLVERFFIFGVPIISFLLGSRLFGVAAGGAGRFVVTEENDVPQKVERGPVTRIFFWSVVTLTFLYLNREVVHSIGHFYEPLELPAVTLVWIGLAAVLLWRSLLHPDAEALRVFLWLAVVALLTKVVFFDVFYWKPGPDLAFGSNGPLGGYFMRLVDYGGVIAFLVIAWRLFRRRGDAGVIARAFGYLALGMAFVYATQEVWTALVHHLPGFRRGGISVFWSFFAFAMLLAGIVRQLSGMRRISLALLLFVVLKVFLVDLADLEQIHRIVAFIILGVVVLVCSFLYLQFRSAFETENDAANDDS